MGLLANLKLRPINIQRRSYGLVLLEVTRLDRSKLTPYIFSIAQHSKPNIHLESSAAAATNYQGK